MDRQNTYDNNATNIDFGALFSTLFNKSNFVLLLWFLAIYMVAYFLIYIFSNGSKNEDVQFQIRFSRFIDFVFLFFTLIIVVITMFSMPSNKKEEYVENSISAVISFVNQPISLLSTILFLFGFYLCIYVLQIPMTAITKPIFVMIIETVLWLLLLIIIFFDFFKYVLGISPLMAIQNMNLWNSLQTPTPAPTQGIVNIHAPTPTSTPNTNQPTNEVFNISNNLYTYDDAQSICSAFGATIATYDQVEDAYNNGGEWCNYGWSDGQMALFPTQKATWNTLQKNPKLKNNCGRPGVNGGYMANPYMKFGVNCYGKKPTPSPLELSRMNSQQNQPIPLTAQDQALNAKIQYWKDNISSLLVNSYNNSMWSEFNNNMNTVSTTAPTITTLPTK